MLMIIVYTYIFIYSLHFVLSSIFNGIGVFDFSNSSQSLVLKRCSDTYSIKCHVCVHNRELQNKKLWQQRWDLLHLIENFICRGHSHCIPKARKPVAYVECPMHRDEECAPHLPLDTVRSNMLCTKVNRCVPRDVYSLLLEPTDQSSK